MSHGYTPRRLPFDPVLRIVRQLHVDYWVWNDTGELVRVLDMIGGPTDDMRPSNDDIARHIGIPRAQVRRYRQHGIPVVVADRVATHLGRHIDDLWPHQHRTTSLYEGAPIHAHAANLKALRPRHR